MWVAHASGSERAIGRAVIALLAAFAFLVSPAAAFAQDATIEVDADDTPLKISGFIGDASGFTGTMRLTAKGNVGTFRWLFSDLRGSGQTITRNHLSLVGETSLKDEDTVDVEVKVDGVAEPGTYEGKVELIPAGQKRATATTVPIELTATARPVLTAKSNRDTVSGKVTKCGLLGCGPAGFLVPGDAGNKPRSIEFTLGKGQTAKVTAVDVFVDGETNEHQVTAAQLGIPETFDEAARVLSIPTEIDADALDPDHYTGSLQLEVENVDAPVVVPVDFSVRAAPWLALVVLAFGFVVGLVTKFFRGEATALLALYRRAALLERRLEASSIPDKAPLRAMITTARAAIAANEADQAKSVLDDVAAELEKANVSTAAAPAAGAAGGTANPPFYRTETLLKGLNVAAAVAVALVIVFTGFQTQYVNNGTTFGAADIWDYIALAAWGFAAAIAGKAVASAR